MGKKSHTEDEVAASEAVAAVTDVSAKKKKKDKKDKKNKKSKASESESVATPAEAEVKEVDDAGEKKKKKKDKKRKLAEVTPEEGDATSTTDDGEKKKKKKDKKEKKEKKEKKSSASTDAEAKSADGLVRVSSSDCYQQPAPSDSSFVKAFYTEHESVTSLSEEKVAEFHQKHEISLSGTRCGYKPVQQFNQTGFSSQVLTVCGGFQAPTPIQAQCWPILSSGRDIIGIAETGSGKTLAFTLPALVHILDKKKRGGKKKGAGPTMLVIAPTRELASQSAEVCEKAGKSCGVRSICVYGGVAKHDQRSALRSGVEIVVATPGRLKDLIEEGSCSLANVTYLVLDEADRMLDMGFERDVRALIGSTHKERQTAMFSATWPATVQKLASEFLSEPVKVTIGSDDLCASGNVTQIVEVVEDRSRDKLIQGLLSKYHSSRRNRVLLFVLYKKEASRVEGMLKRNGWDCVAIHGDKEQSARTAAVERFKQGKCPLLIATDVAARGLDIPGVEYVLNYSFPLTIEDYVHRIGRTGRGGNKGTSHTFFTAFDKPRAGELANLLRDSNQPVPEALMKFGTHVKKKEHKLYGAFGKDVDMSVKPKSITFDDSDDE